MSDRPVVRIATYGIQQRWTNRGAWAAVVYRGEKVTAVSGCATDPTTRNRMSYRAVLEGLKNAPLSSDITIQSDVELVVKSLNHDWKLCDDVLLIYYHEIMRIIEDPGLNHRIKVIKVPMVVVSIAKQAAMKVLGAQNIDDPYHREQPQVF